MASGQGGTPKDVISTVEITGDGNTALTWLNGWYSFDIGDTFDTGTIKLQSRLVTTNAYKTVAIVSANSFIAIKLTGYVNVNMSGAGTESIFVRYVQTDQPIK